MLVPTGPMPDGAVGQAYDRSERLDHHGSPVGSERRRWDRHVDDAVFLESTSVARLEISLDAEHLNQDARQGRQ